MAQDQDAWTAAACRAAEQSAHWGTLWSTAEASVQSKAAAREQLLAVVAVLRQLDTQASVE